jgi:cell division septation protein DedD
MKYYTITSIFLHKKGFLPVLKNIIPLFILLFFLTTPSISSVGKSFYSISLGFYETEADAEKQVEQLKGAGHNAFYREEIEEEHGEKIYRIYIERYPSKNQAENEARVLRELDLISDYTIREIKEETETNANAEENQPDKKEDNKPEVKKEEKEQAVTEREKTEAPQKKPEPREIKGNFMRVGSFKEKDNVDNLLNTLVKSGYNAFYRYEQVGSKGKYYRLYIDGYKTKNDAISEARKLKKSGIISDYIINPGIIKEQITPSKKEKDEDNRELFFLHVSSFQYEKNAEEEVQKLKDYGLKAFLVEEKISGKKWYRVYVGEFTDEQEARKSGGELLDRGIISYFRPLAINRDKIEKQP